MIQRQNGPKQALLSKTEQSKLYIPYSKQQPQLFVWKRLALIICCLIAVMLVVDIIMLIYLDSHPQPPINLTFVNDIIDQSNILENKQTVVNLMQLMAKSNRDVKFQYANRLVGGLGSQYTYDNILENTMTLGYKNLLHIFQLQQGQTEQISTAIIGFYIPDLFKVPQTNPDDDDIDPINQTLQYYTFQYGDNRMATILGLGSVEEDEIQYNQTFYGQYLKANQNDIQDFDPLNCKTYRMMKKQQYFTLFQIMKIELSRKLNETAKVSMQLGQSKREIFECFNATKNRAVLQQKLQNLFDGKIEITSSQQIRVKKFEIFELFNY